MFKVQVKLGSWNNRKSCEQGLSERLERSDGSCSFFRIRYFLVWISLGTCDDGSVVILHSTPSYSRTGQPGGGVQISAIGQDESCEAYTLADRYMAEYFPKWYGRYPAALKKPENYFHFEGEKAGLFRWNTGEGGKLSDPAGVQKMQPEEVLELLFGMPANG